MQLLIRFAKFITDSQIFISIGASCFYLTGFFIQQGDLQNPPLFKSLVIGVSTWLIYSVYRNKAKPERLKKEHLLGGFTLLIFILLLIDFSEFFFLTHLAILSLLYQPTSWFNNKWVSLRSTPFLKLVVLAYVWSSMSSFLPCYDIYGNFFHEKSIILFFAHFLFVTAITLPFEIRDFWIDKQHKIITIANYLGVVPTKLLSVFLFIAFTVLAYLIIDKYLLFLLPVIAIPLILFSSLQKPSIYYTFLIDGLFVLYFVLILFIF